MCAKKHKKQHRLRVRCVHLFPSLVNSVTGQRGFCLFVCSFLYNKQNEKYKKVDITCLETFLLFFVTRTPWLPACFREEGRGAEGSRHSSLSSKYNEMNYDSYHTQGVRGKELGRISFTGFLFHLYAKKCSLTT